MEHVRGVLEKDTAAKPDPSTGRVAENAQPKTEQTKPDGVEPFHDHPRWKELNAERASLRTELDQTRPEAEQYRKVTGFMANNGLSADEVATGFSMMARIKAGDTSVIAELDKYRNALLSISGDVLPKDLQEKVDQGLIDADSAKELARLRIGHTAATHQLGQTAEERRQANVRVLATEMQSAVVQWEQSEVSRNPDYPNLAPLVRDRAQVIMNDQIAQGRGPVSAADAVAIVRQAYSDVHGHLTTKLLMQRQPMRARSFTSRPANAAPAPPKTMMEAAERALEEARDQRSGI